MELIDAIKSRSSVRKFSSKPIEDNIIEEIIELGNLAPSAGNLQPRDFVVVKNEDTKEKLAQAALNQRFVAEVPVVIVVCANIRRVSSYGRRGMELYCYQDSAAAIENMLLAIVDKGLACCWVGAFNENAVSKILDLPDHVRPIALLPIGYSDEKVGHTSRIDIDELVHYEKW